jgi:hypothetical protein
MTDKAIGEAAGALLRAGVPLVVDAIGDALARAHDPATRLANIRGDIARHKSLRESLEATGKLGPAWRRHGARLSELAELEELWAWQVERAGPCPTCGREHKGE